MASIDPVSSGGSVQLSREKVQSAQDSQGAGDQVKPQIKKEAEDTEKSADSEGSRELATA